MALIPRNEEHAKALALRAAEVRAQALGDEDFMHQVRDGHERLARGERGTPLRELLRKTPKKAA
jgi:hypothetical protein